MKTSAIEVPIKGKREGGFQLIDTPAPFSFLTYVLGRNGYSLLETISSKYFKYYQNASKDEKTELVLFTPKIKPLDEKSIKGAISDTVYQNKIVEVDVLDAVASFTFTINAGHWWLRYGLPIMTLAFTSVAGYAYGTWVDLLLALYLFKGREIFVEKSLEKQYKEYIDKAKVGIRNAYKNIENIREIEHSGLRELKEGIDKAPNKTEGYIWALHSAGKLGLPELRTFYSFNSAIEEWEYEEVGRNFDVFEDTTQLSPIECGQKSKRTTYEPVGVKKELVEAIFNKGDDEDEKS